MPYTKCKTCGHKVKLRNLDKHIWRAHTIRWKRPDVDMPDRPVKPKDYWVGGERIATLRGGYGGY